MADYAFFTMLMWVVAGVALLLGIAIVAGLIGWIRVSFHSRLARLTFVGFCCIVLICAGVFTKWYYLYQTPENIVQRSHAIPLTDGVCLLNGHQSIGLESSEIWLRFTMSPEDLKRILASERYERLPFMNMNYYAYGAPKWWMIGYLGGAVEYYQCESGPSMGYDWTGKDLIVNRETNEALFLMRCEYK